jgi:speckle-type POZ protein
MFNTCQQADGSYTFICKILSHLRKGLETSHPLGIAINCLNGLSAHFQGLFDSMQLSDVIFNIEDRQFPAHKLILAARSEVFAAMFQHPTKENLTNQITIQDIEPEVFHELLRFIYTGRVSLEKMDSLAAGLFIAADKYLVDELKRKCENYLLHHMSPDICIELLLRSNLLNPMEYVKEAAKFFRRYTIEVMATNRWKRSKLENPIALVEIQEFVYGHK